MKKLIAFVLCLLSYSSFAVEDQETTKSAITLPNNQLLKSQCAWFLVRNKTDFEQHTTSLSKAEIEVRKYWLLEVAKAKKVKGAEIVKAGLAYFQSRNSIRHQSELIKSTKLIRLNLLRKFLPYIASIDDLQEMIQNAELAFAFQLSRWPQSADWGNTAILLQLSRDHLEVETQLYGSFVRMYKHIKVKEGALKNIARKNRRLLSQLLEDPELMAAAAESFTSNLRYHTWNQFSVYLKADERNALEEIHSLMMADTEPYEFSATAQLADKLEIAFKNVIEGLYSRVDGTNDDFRERFVRSERYQTIFYKRFYAENPLSQEQLAEQMGVSRGRVAQVEQQLLRALRRQMKILSLSAN